MGSPPTLDKLGKHFRPRTGTPDVTPSAPSDASYVAPSAPSAPSAPRKPITYTGFRQSLRTREREELGTSFGDLAEIKNLPYSFAMERTLEREHLGPGISKDDLTPIEKASLGMYDMPLAGISETDSRRRLLAMRTAGVLLNRDTGQPLTPLPFEHIQAEGRTGVGLPFGAGSAVKGFFGGLKTGTEGIIGDVATQFTGRGWTGDPVDFRFTSTFERENDIIWVISGLEPQDVRDIAARTFPEDVPGQAVTDPVQLKEEAEQREAQKLLQRAIQISKQPGSTQESIGQIIGSTLTMGVGEEPITFRTMNDMNPFLAALLSFPISGTLGIMPIARGIAVPATRFAVRQTATGLSRHTQALTAMYTPEVHRAGMTFANYINDTDPVWAGRVKSPTVPLPSANLFNFGQIQPGLTRGENLMNIFRKPLVGRTDWVLDDELATPVMKERAIVNDRIQNVSNALSQKYHALLNDAFDFNDKNQVIFGKDQRLFETGGLRGIDPELTIPRTWKEHRKGVFTVTPAKTLLPTIQDIAARLPVYRPHLSDEQLDVLRQLQDDLKPYATLLDEVGVERGIRSDIMEGGFYIPRGRAIREGGLNTPVKVPRVKPKGEGPRGPEKIERLTSMGEGIDEGYEYAAIGEVLEDYAIYTGERSFNIHVGNYFKGLRDADGRLIVLSPAMQVDSELRNLITKIRRNIKSSQNTIREQNTREGVYEQVAVRDVRRVGQAQARAEAASQRVDPRTEGFRYRDPVEQLEKDLHFSRKELETAITEARTFAEQYGNNARHLQVWKPKLNKAEQQLKKDVEDLIKAIREGENSIENELKNRISSPRLSTQKGRATRTTYTAGLSRTVGSHMAKANQLTTKVNNLSGEVEKMSSKVDDLIERGEILSDVLKDNRIKEVASRKAERAAVQQLLRFSALKREMRVLEREANRANRFANQSGEQLRNQKKRMANSKTLLAKHQKELDEVQGEWDRMITSSKKPREGYAYVDLPGMEGRFFPEEMAAAINKKLIAEGSLRGRTSGGVRVLAGINKLLQGLETTADMSGIGLQGLAGMYANQRAWASAVKTSFEAWGAEGDRVLGRFIGQFDKTSKSTGRLTAGEWAGNYNLSVRGAQMGELQVGTTGVAAALGRVPIIKQANRAFGFFGDTLRLEWADDMLQNELSMGKTLEQLRRNGDLERIAEIANNMTGHARGHTGSDFAQLVLFAPRFLQSRLSTVARAAAGLRFGAELDQRIARRSMLKMVGSAVTYTHLINWMQGHETDMRPWVRGNPNSNFLRARIGNRDFSLLGTWDSLAKGLMLTAMGRPHDVLRTLSSPMLRVGWDIFSGSTAIGERTRAEERGMANLWSPETGYYALKAITPFSFQEIPEATRAAKRGELLTAGVTLAGEIFGMKSGPLGYIDQKDFARRQMFPDTAEKDLTADQKRQINNNEEVQKALLGLEDRRAPMNLSQVISNRFDRFNEVKESGEATLESNILAGVSGDEIRSGIKTLKRTRFEASNNLLGDEKIQAEFKKKSKNQHIWDTLAQAYWMADAPDPMSDLRLWQTPEGRVTVEVDFDARDDTREEILAEADGIDEDIRAYITGFDANGEPVPIDPVTGERNTYRGKRYDNKVVREMIERFEADQIVMKPYLQATRNLAEQRGLLNIYREWRASNDSEVFLDRYPILRRVLKDAGKNKTRMRRNDVNLERKLWMWGYITTAENSRLKEEIRQLRLRQGGEITNTLAIERELAVAP